MSTGRGTSSGAGISPGGATLPGAVTLPDLVGRSPGPGRLGPLDQPGRVEQALRGRFDELRPDEGAFLWRPTSARPTSGGRPPQYRAVTLLQHDWLEGGHRRRVLVLASVPRHAQGYYCRVCDVIVGVALLGEQDGRVEVLDAKLDLGRFGGYGRYSADDVAVVELAFAKYALQLVDHPQPGSLNEARIELVALFDGAVRRIGRFPVGTGRPDAGGCEGRRTVERCLQPVRATVELLPDPAGGFARVALTRFARDGDRLQPLGTEVHEYDGRGYASTQPSPKAFPPTRRRARNTAKP